MGTAQYYIFFLHIEYKFSRENEPVDDNTGSETRPPLSAQEWRKQRFALNHRFVCLQD